MSDDEPLEEPDELSDEEKLAICKHFLMSCPPGQFNDMVTDIDKLLPKGLLSQSIISSYARQYNLRHGAVVSTPFQSRAIISKEAEINYNSNENAYYDSKNEKFFGVDHVSKTTFELTSSVEVPSSMHYLHTEHMSIQEAFNAYMIKRYTTPENAACAFTLSDTHILVKIVAEKANLKNYWSGKWTSSWKIIFPENSIANSTDAHSAVVADSIESQVSVSGYIQVMAHYFEDGNVQLNTTKSIPAFEVKYVSHAELARYVVNAVEKIENEIQGSLNDMYMEMHDHTLRAMRRTLPVTRTKMEWNMNAHQMNKTVLK